MLGAKGHPDQSMSSCPDDRWEIASIVASIEVFVVQAQSLRSLVIKSPLAVLAAHIFRMYLGTGPNSGYGP